MADFAAFSASVAQFQPVSRVFNGDSVVKPPKDPSASSRRRRNKGEGPFLLVAHVADPKQAESEGCEAQGSAAAQLGRTAGGVTAYRVTIVYSNMKDTLYCAEANYDDMRRQREEMQASEVPWGSFLNHLHAALQPCGAQSSAGGPPSTPDRHRGGSPPPSPFRPAVMPESFTLGFEGESQNSGDLLTLRCGSTLHSEAGLNFEFELCAVRDGDEMAGRNQQMCIALASQSMATAHRVGVELPAKVADLERQLARSREMNISLESQLQQIRGGPGGRDRDGGALGLGMGAKALGSPAPGSPNPNDRKRKPPRSLLNPTERKKVAGGARMAQ